MSTIDITHLRSDAEILEAIRKSPKNPGTTIIFPYVHCQSLAEATELCMRVENLVGNNRMAFCGRTGYIYWGVSKL